MHLIATIPGGWDPDQQGVFHVQQEPGDILFLSSADSEISTVNRAYRELAEQEEGLPSLRLVNLGFLKQELSIDTYIEEVASQSKLIILRLLGGRAYHEYLCDALTELSKERNIPVIFLSGHNEPDMELLELTSANAETADRIWKYLVAGGVKNAREQLKFVFNQFFENSFEIEEPAHIPEQFLYHPDRGILQQAEQDRICEGKEANIAIIAYRSYYLSEDLDAVHKLAKELEEWNCAPVIAMVLSLRDEAGNDELHRLLTNDGKRSLHGAISLLGFTQKPLHSERSFIYRELGVPVVQGLQASCTREIWEEGNFGLPPTDIAMNVALPEVDGKIISRPVSFKGDAGRDELTDSDIIRYEAHQPGCAFVAEHLRRWVRLQEKANAEKRIALILPNYPSKDSRMANGVGLDTPASTVRILEALQEEGYDIGEEIPEDGNALVQRLSEQVTNEADMSEFRSAEVRIEEGRFFAFYNRLSKSIRRSIEERWGHPYDAPNHRDGSFVLPGFCCGNIFVTLQPSRGYNIDQKASYHSPDLPPTYDYLAFYCWVQQEFEADAVVHTGKHGNLEWLPGKSIALDPSSCFPAAALDAIPHFYPFIINDPGEGAQAKRRNQAVIIDHLIPPMTRAEGYGSLLQLEQLIDEYYQAATQHPERVERLKKKILDLVKEAHLDQDLEQYTHDVDELLNAVDGYLCELKEAQIRGGLHILGQLPKDERLSDLLVSLHRLPNSDLPGITQALAQDLELGVDPLDDDFKTAFDGQVKETPCRTVGDVVERLEELAKSYVEDLLWGKGTIPEDRYPRFASVLKGIRDETLPERIRPCVDEIGNLLKGLDGAYVPSGGAGAPTRGKLDILPTGRNFYSVDIRTVPTETACELGQKSAEDLLERYIQENGEYPESIGISVWGTATMRTGGDDIGQALALIGVKPVWEGKSRRIKDFEVQPLPELGRPRVDVMLRISGFFRDAFPDLISLFNAAIERVSELEEPLDQNPIRKRYLEEEAQWKEAGLEEKQARERALYRVFGSKPGAYGAGLQGLIDEKNWRTEEDLAQVYINWSGYAYYGPDNEGRSAHETFRKRLRTIDAVMQNQDNREHDILDSDDYYQFQGGLTNAVSTEKGEAPSTYFGDHSRPDNPKVKSLKEELLKVYRSRAVNPKWMEAMKEHGYKGAFEMMATMDYLFAYDATTNLVDDFMYQGITESYLLDEENRRFIEENNPWALRDMSERMLEAIQRGMWQNPEEGTEEQLKSLYMETEGVLEERGSSSSSA